MMRTISVRISFMALSMLTLIGCRMMAEDQPDVLSHLAGATVRTLLRMSPAPRPQVRGVAGSREEGPIVISRDHASLLPISSSIISTCPRAAQEWLTANFQSAELQADVRETQADADMDHQTPTLDLLPEEQMVTVLSADGSPVEGRMIRRQVIRVIHQNLVQIPKSLRLCSKGSTIQSPDRVRDAVPSQVVDVDSEPMNLPDVVMN
jgi:hypothetical protein